MSDDPAVLTPDPTPRPGLAPNVQGALWILASAVCFTAMTTLVKFLGTGYSPSGQAFYRNGMGFLILLPIILRHRSAAFATPDPWPLLLRAVAGVLSVTLSFYGFQHMPLADANTLSFTRALWMVPLAAFALGEKIGPMRLGATIVGFGGVLLLARPGADGHFALGLPALVMMFAAFLAALMTAGMKYLTRTNSPRVILVWSATLGMLTAIPGAALTWRWPTPHDLVLLCLMGAIGTANQTCLVKCMQIGDAAAMAPIDYARIVFSLIVGIVLFHEVPSVWTLTGAAIVVGSTLFITLREQYLARRGVTQAKTA